MANTRVEKEKYNGASDPTKAKKKPFSKASGGGGEADWTGVEGKLLTHAVAAIGKHGGALRFGYTRDGGAYSIGVYDGDDKNTIYVSPNEDIEQTLRELIEYYET